MQATYCVSCRKNTRNKSAKVDKTKTGRLILKSICSVCGNKKPTFISKNEGSGILSFLGLRAPLRKLPLLGDVLF